ncbi:copper chaperone PCu(A)C [Niveispirillum irakense]|uniref:copper chaperone PCu(A)C n=1 Tax=Niveispirillum irakense TaxID=34011 RepID=UPI000412358C|nr:copper chaperone PCu(A)C [Niveispirillum irakense]
MKFFAKHLAFASLASLMMMGMAHAADGVSVSEPFARATAPSAKAGAAFLTLSIASGEDKLLSVASPVAEKVELHNHIMEDGIARMRAVDAIPVVAGTPTALKPGGLHIMLIGLKQQLKEGDTVPLTLRFEKAGDVVVAVPVKGAGVRPGGDDHSGHGHGHSH